MGRRFVFLCFAIILIPIILIGCGDQKIATSEKVSTFGKDINIRNDIKQIKIADSRGYGQKNDNYFLTLNEGLALEQFQTILTSAIDDKKTRTERYPSHNIVITYEDDQQVQLHLLLGVEGQASAFVHEENVDELFWVSVKDTEQLKEILEVKRPSKMILDN